MSDDEGDVIVMQRCAGAGCAEIYGLEFDENIGENFCVACRDKLRRAEETNDFRVLLSPDDRKAIELIFNKFDHDRKGFWHVEEFNEYMDMTSANRNDHVDAFETNEEVADYVREEYDVPCERVEVPGRLLGLPDDSLVTLSNVVTVTTLERIYGGYMYHGVNALRDDVTALEDAGEVNFDVLE